MAELADIKQRLADRIDLLAEDLLGPPTTKTRHVLRWGRKGSVQVNIAGRWRGNFRSWEADEGGGPIDLIAFALGIPFREAVQWAEQWLGDDARSPPRTPRPRLVDVDEEELRRIGRTRQMWEASVPVSGSLAEKYLNGRGISYDTWPKAVRYCPKDRALIVASTSPDGELTQTQRIFLDEHGARAIDADGEKRHKVSFGPSRNGAVRLAGDQRALLLAEGPETGLSVHMATGLETWIALGQVHSIDLSPIPLGRTIIVCRDDDGRAAQSTKSLNKAIRKWRKEGRTVLAVLPHGYSREDKSDFNDALVKYGPANVSDRIEAVLAPVGQKRGEMHVSWARKALKDAVSSAVSELWEHPEKAVGIKVSLGLGKTAACIDEAVAWVNAGRGNVVFAVPTHHLSGEVVERIKTQAGSIKVAVWRGRESADPDNPDEMMCRDIEAVREVQVAGGDPQSHVCVNGDRKCPFFDVCAYQRQRQQSGQIWVVAHHALFTQKPEPIPSPSLVIIDESFAMAGLRGVSGNPIMVSEYQIERSPWSPHGAGATADLHADLMPMREKLASIVKDHRLGPVSRKALVDGGLTADECRQAAGAEWKRKAEIEVYPGMAPADRNAALKKAKDNAEIPRMARMWRLLADVIEGDSDLSGCLSIAENEKDGAVYRGLRLQWREDIREGWKAATLHVDATLQDELVRPYFPEIEILPEVKAEAPHQKIYQYTGQGFSHAALKNEKLVADVWAWCRYKAMAGGQWLVVIPKAAEDIIRFGKQYARAIPDNIHLTHHNAIRGRDTWRDVQGVIVIGRTQPPPQAVESIAGALSGRHIEINKPSFYAQRTVRIEDATGNAATLEVDTAGDTLCEAVRRNICDGEIEQIIGRGRGVNRTADDPVEIHVLGNIPLDQAVDELQDWKRLSKDEALVADGGVWLESITDMAKAYGIPRDTLKDARCRGMGVSPNKTSYLGNTPTPRTAKYQLKGAGRKEQIAHFAPGIDIESWLTDHLGELKALKIDDPAPARAGKLSPDIIAQAKAFQRSQGIRQAEFAKMIGISRPTLANALQGRFGLGEIATSALCALLADPPDDIQAELAI